LPPELGYKRVPKSATNVINTKRQETRKTSKLALKHPRTKSRQSQVVDDTGFFFHHGFNFELSSLLCL